MEAGEEGDPEGRADGEERLRAGRRVRSRGAPARFARSAGQTPPTLALDPPK